MKRQTLLIILFISAIINCAAQAAEWLAFDKKYIKKTSTQLSVSKISHIQSESVGTKKITMKPVMPGCYKSKNVLPDGKRYDVITAPGESEMPVGKPDIPAFTQWVLVPNGSEIKLEINKGKAAVYHNFDIQPVQPEPPESIDNYIPEFTIDQNIYGKNESFPGVLAKFDTVQKIRGQDSSMIWIYPYQYNPVTKILTVYPDLEVIVHFTGEGKSVEKRLRTKTFDNYFRRIAPNADNILALPPEDLNKLNANSDGGFLPTGCELMIICAPQFTNSARIISEWKTKRGFITEVVTTDEIGNTTNEIRSYIKNAYDTYSPAPSYILLMGDSDHVPPWYVLNHSYHGFLTGVDFYYADMNDPFDYTADMAIGRWSINTPSEADIFANRLIEYETESLPDFFYTNTTHAAYFQHAGDGYAERRFAKTSEEMRDFLFIKGYNPERIYVTGSSVFPSNWTKNSYIRFENDGAGGLPVPSYLMKPGFAWDGDKYDIRDAVNSGTFLLTHRDHGARNGWGDPDYRSDDVDTLNNGNRRPVVFTLNCQTAWFDNETDPVAANTSMTDECFSEHWFNHPTGGAIGLIGATRVSWSGKNDRLCWGWMDAIWTNYIESNMGVYDGGDPIYRMGDVLNYGKTYFRTKYPNISDGDVKTSISMFTWLGDPTMEIWTDIPENINVTHDASIDIGSSSVDVNVDIDNALVCCVLENEIVGKEFSSGGFARISFSPSLSIPGDMYITVTKHNYIPYQGALSVTTSSANVSYDRHEAYENGDGNGLIEAGENMDLRVWLQNRGPVTASNVFLSLTNEAQYLTVNTPSLSYGNIDPGSVSSNALLFTVSISGNCPVGKQVLKAIIQSDNESRTNFFTVNIKSTRAATTIEWSTVISPENVDSPFDVNITARDTDGRIAKTFTNTVNIKGFMPIKSDSSIVISEMCVGNDSAEFINVSDSDVDISNWKLILYDKESWPNPLLSFNVPSGTICHPNDIFTIKENFPFPGTYPNFATGSNIFWSSATKAATLLLDNLNNIVDFVCANGGEVSQIHSPFPIPPEQWTSTSVPSGASYQRIGNSDNNSKNDWSITEKSSIGSLNIGMDASFVDYLSISVSPDVSPQFNAGVWNGSVTVHEFATNMFLRAETETGLRDKTESFDVLYPDGIAFVRYLSHTVFESGDNNGLIEAGESADISLALENIGSVSASNVFVTFTNLNAYLSVDSPPLSFGNIPSLTAADNPAMFNVAIASNCPAGPQELKAIISSDNGSWTNSFSLTVEITGPAESFEWSYIPRAQVANIPIQVTVTARDADGLVAKDFNSTASINGYSKLGETDISIGSGTTSWSYPLYTYYHDSRTQVIYPTNNLPEACSIKSLAINITKSPGQVMKNWTIRMKHSLLSVYPETPEWETNDWVIVYQNDEPVPATGWKTFDFSTPFEYNGIDNLMIDFSHNNDSYTSFGECQMTDSGINQAIYGCSDSSKGDPLNWSTSYGPNVNTGKKVPNIILNTEERKAVAVSPVSSGIFDAGIWNGYVSVLDTQSNIFLQADSQNRISGKSSLFDVFKYDFPFPELSSQAFIDLSDGDGYFEPGESVGLSLNIINSGAVTATNVLVSLTNLSPLLAVSEVKSFGNISPGSIASNSSLFSFLIAPSCTSGYHELQTIILSENNSRTNSLMVFVDTVPEIDISFTNISLSVLDGNSNSIEMTMNNTGSAALEFNVNAVPVESVAWLTYNPENGIVLPGGETSIWYTCNADGLIDGVYRATISIVHNVNEDPLEVFVEFLVPEPYYLLFIIYQLLFINYYRRKLISRK